jgi:DNA-binding MarR family transcriptional regulator
MATRREATSEGKRVPTGYGPIRPPSGTDNFGNLFRDPGLVLSEIVAREVAAAGFADLRPSLLAVGQHVGADGTRITELAKRSQLTKASVVAAVDELERLGYAERVEDPSDGRAKLVRPTERARRAEEAARTAIAATRDAWAEALGEERMAELERGLRELRLVLWPDPE